jgi:RNA polymerase sigma factor (sigma-70 family)
MSCPGVTRRTLVGIEADIARKGTQRRPWPGIPGVLSQSRLPRCLGDVVDSRAAHALAVPFVTGGSLRSRASSGTATGFDRLFIEEYPRVAAIANRVLADPAGAEDVAQEVFLDLHRRFGDDPGAKAPGWLHSAAVHTALNAIRSERRRSAREERSLAGPSPADDPQIAAEVAETRRAILALLGRIPRRHAMVLALRYSGLSYAEIATALGIGVNGVGTRLRRAEARLRKEVGDASI